MRAKPLLAERQPRERSLLLQVPDEWLFEPWRMPVSLKAQLGIKVGEDIPEPRVELAPATREAKDRLHDRLREAAVRTGKAAVINQHASHKNWGKPSAKRKTAPDGYSLLMVHFGTWALTPVGTPKADEDNYGFRLIHILG